MRILHVVFLLAMFTAILPKSASGFYTRQYSWSGGPGVLGPVGTNWGDTFYSQYGMNWDCIPPGKLYLGISSTQHVINNDMDGCEYAFPADMDGDGDLDVVASEQSTGTPYTVAWFENNSSGSGWYVHIVSQNYAVFNCVYPADIDCDGDIDLVGGNMASGKFGIEWFRNNDGVGGAWTRFRIAYWGACLYTYCADIDGNDTLEVVAPYWGTPNQILWWEPLSYPPDSTWYGHVITGGIGQGRELFPIDLNQDGNLDIVVANENQNGLKWYQNPDTIGVSWVGHQVGAYNDLPYSAHAADLDGDGDVDVLCCQRTGQGELIWYENLDGYGINWDKHLLESDLYYPQNVWAEDMTGDGCNDILLACHNDCYLYVNVDGTGMEWAKHHICNGSCSIRPAELNGDGNLDILTGASTVYWHELEGDTQGWLMSSILDVNTSLQWDSITWVADEPLGTDLFFQVRASNDWENMGAWCDTIFQPRSLAGLIGGNERYLQYRVGMTSDTEYRTPVLDEIRFYWTLMGIEGEEGDSEFSVSAYPNPSSGSVSISIPAAFTGSTEILVYDLSGKLVRRFGDLQTNVIQWDCEDWSGSEVPSGIYLIQAISGDQVRTIRLVRL